MLVFVAVATNARAESARDTAFEQGVRSYKQGQYQQALTAFQKSDKQQSKVAFNIGMAMYKLQMNAEAMPYFRYSAKDPAYEDISNYQIGLLYVRMDDYDKGRAYLNKTIAVTDKRQLRMLATSALAKLGGEGHERKRFFPHLAFGVGSDSNLNLFSEELVGATSSKLSDEFHKTLAGFNYRLDAQGTTWVSASLLLNEYFNEDDYSFRSLDIGLRHLLHSGAWKTYAHGGVGKIDYGGDTLQYTLNAAISTDSRTTSCQVRTKFSLAKIKAGSQYGFLDGVKFLYSGSYKSVRDGWWWRIGNAIEVNDREDLDTVTGFFSRSPTRLSGELAMGWDITDSLSMTANARYRISTYRKPDEFLDEGVAKRKRRKERLGRIGLDASYSFKPSLRAVIGYEYSENRSNFDRFIYDRNRWLFSLKWQG